jgi:Fe-S-cluster formation regulator IscX/YfhJ
MCIMASPRSTRGASKPEPHPKTVQRTYRFDTKTFTAFEDDCAQHLSNPKRVIEALILHWLDAGTEERAAMAQMHRQRIGAGSHDEE